MFHRRLAVLALLALSQAAGAADLTREDFEGRVEGQWFSAAVNRKELKRLIDEGINSGPSIPGDVVFARLRARAAEIERRVEAG